MGTKKWFLPITVIVLVTILNSLTAALSTQQHRRCERNVSFCELGNSKYCSLNLKKLVEVAVSRMIHFWTWSGRETLDLRVQDGLLDCKSVQFSPDGSLLIGKKWLCVVVGCFLQLGVVRELSIWKLAVFRWDRPTESLKTVILVLHSILDVYYSSQIRGDLAMLRRRRPDFQEKIILSSFETRCNLFNLILILTKRCLIRAPHYCGCSRIMVHVTRKDLQFGHIKLQTPHKAWHFFLLTCEAELNVEGMNRKFSPGAW